MDGRRFDDLLRAVTNSRRSVLGGAIAGLAGVLGISIAEAKKKKKKKPCKKKCQDGCCTGKHGKCVKPSQQTPTQCGTGGEICRNNCGGSGSCKDGCDTCCAGDACLDAGQISNEQCGVGGEACFACPPGQTCNAPGPGCCARQGAECGSNGVECCAGQFLTCGPDDFCCVANHNPCTETSDCCDEEDVCDGGFCGRPLDAPCPGDILCIPSLQCDPGTGLCSDCPEGEQTCGTGCCDQRNCCFNSGVCCTFECCGSGGSDEHCCEFAGCCA